jgi:hypothetical protein
MRRSRVFCCALVLVVGIATAAPLSFASGGEVPFRASFDTQFQVNSGAPLLNITVQGEGQALHMGESETFTNNEIVNLMTGAGTATYTVIAANGDTVVFDSTFDVLPTSTGVTFEGTYEIVGGTGRFSGATGRGRLIGSAVFTGPDIGVGEFSWEGTISSHGSL